MNLYKIKERLQKLKALSKSPNKNEMLAAIKKMKEVLEEHGLKESDIPDIETNAIKVERFTIWKGKKGKYTDDFDIGFRVRTLKAWEKKLADAIALAYDCILTFGKHTLNFYGFKEDVFVANEMYQWIITSMRKESKLAYARRSEFDNEVNPIVFQQSFMMGVTEAIVLKSDEIIEEKERTLKDIESELLGTTGNQLAIIKNSKIKEAIGEVKKVSLDFEAKDYAAICSGYEAADKIQLRKQID